MRKAFKLVLLLMVLSYIPAPVLGSVPLYPDLQTVVPQHLQIVNDHQREVLRFSNAIANTGDGPWRMRPEFPLGDVSRPQKAVQEVLDADGNIAFEKAVSEFQFHPEHNHWHINAVALLRKK